jgi:enoyl-CoA hydratase/carnithine racemase
MSGMFDEKGVVFVSGGELASIFRGGKGQLFCLKGRKKWLHHYSKQKIRSIKMAYNKIERSLKPFIAVINGHALGGGCELAMACHLRFMTDSPKAQIGCPELNLGLTPGWGGIQRMPRIIGKSKALDFIFFSKKVSGAEALALGLVDKVCPAADLMKEAMDYAIALSKRPPLAVSAVLEGMAVGLEKGIDAGLETDRRWIERLKVSKDTVEGMTAFFEKREPKFKGE